MLRERDLERYLSRDRLLDLLRLRGDAVEHEHYDIWRHEVHLRDRPCDFDLDLLLDIDLSSV